MKQIYQSAAQKRPYLAPRLLTVQISSMQMISLSGAPEVYTTSEKASTDYDALVKENKNNGVWDDEW